MNGNKKRERVGERKRTEGGKNKTKSLNAFQSRKTDLAALSIKDINP